jgi:hypothetical protein
MVRVSVLESEGRTAGYFKVTMRAVIEVNFVARFKTQADRTPESLDSTSGIHGKTCVPGLNATQGSHEPCRRVLIGNAKIHEAELAGDKSPERPSWSGIWVQTTRSRDAGSCLQTAW